MSIKLMCSFIYCITLTFWVLKPTSPKLSHYNDCSPEFDPWWHYLINGRSITKPLKKNYFNQFNKKPTKRILTCEGCSRRRTPCPCGSSVERTIDPKCRRSEATAATKTNAAMLLIRPSFGYAQDNFQAEVKKMSSHINQPANQSANRSIKFYGATKSN